MIDSANISPNVARRILLDAKQNGVTVEDHLEKSPNNQSKRAIKTSEQSVESKVDLTEERDAQMLGLELEKATLNSSAPPPENSSLTDTKLH